MRTTLNLDDDVFELARSLAEARRSSIGKVLSDLARRGAVPRPSSKSRSGFHTFDVSESDEAFGPEDVRSALEAEDKDLAKQFLSRKR